MTKRFTYEYDEYNGNLFDNKMNTFYHIEDSDENIEVLCDRLNWLVEENEQLKKILGFLKNDNTGDILNVLNSQENKICELKQENVQLKQFQEKVAETIEGKMGDNVCNDYKMQVLKEIWNELNLDEVWFE